MLYSTIASGSPGPVALALNGIQTPIVVTGPAGTVTATAVYRTKAEFDTGSTISSVALSILQQVGAQQVGEVPISTVIGTTVAPVYNAGIGLPLPLAPKRILWRQRSHHVCFGGARLT